MNPKAHIISLVIFSVIVCLVSYGTTGSINPLDVYESGSTTIKVVVSILLGIMGLGLIQLFLSSFIRGNCAGCGKPLMAYAQALGGPMRCGFCRKWYHKKCWENRGASLLEGCGCRSENSGYDSFNQTSR